MKVLFKDQSIYRSEYFDIGQDREVPIAGFFIIAPLRKVRTIDEFTEEEATEFMSIVRKLRKGMKEILGIKDVYLFQNEDTSHNFHFRVFPRHDRMEKLGRKIQSVRPIMERATQNKTDQLSIDEVKSYVKHMKRYMSE